MASKLTASILVIAGGVFYVLSGIAVAVLIESVSSLGGLGSLGGFTGIDSTSASLSGSFDSLAETVAAVGVVTGALIILGGVLVNSERPGRRKLGGILAVIMLLVGGLPTLGGLVIGFILAGIGAYLGLTYRQNMGGIVVGLGPIGSLTLGPQQGQINAPAGTGPLNYCIKCGSQVRNGAVFCGACGARLAE